MSLEGSLPSLFSSITTLRTLDLSYNLFSGTIPNSWWQTSGFEALKHMDLSFNQLSGSLPPAIPAPLTLETLSLAYNRFTGSLPTDWAASSIYQVDLSNNILTGSLPKSWAEAYKLDKLGLLNLASNDLSGTVPVEWMQAQWTPDKPASISTVVIKPGNPRMCGPVYPFQPEILLAVSPRLYPEVEEMVGSVSGIIEKLSRASEQGEEEEESQLAMSNDMLYPVSRISLSWQGLFANTRGVDTNTMVTLTNSLGTCTADCTKSQSDTITTNAFNLGLKHNVSVLDITAKNPKLQNVSAANIPGQIVQLPCYSSFPVDYLGSDAAWNKFAGGNQVMGGGVIGAMLAGAVVEGGAERRTYSFLPDSAGCCLPYQGNEVPSINQTGNNLIYQQPLWWFVDLGVSVQIDLISITAGDRNSGIDIYVGNNSTDIKNNTLVQERLQIGRGEERLVKANAALGQFVTLYAGESPPASLSLSSVQVYPAIANAAANIQILYSSGHTGEISEATQQCATISPDARGTVWATLDLGFVAVVGAVTIDARIQVGRSKIAMAFVTLSPPSRGGTLSDSIAGACSSQEAVVPEGDVSEEVILPCNQEGRMVTLRFIGSLSPVELCGVGVYSRLSPSVNPVNPSGDNSWDGGAIAGLSIALLVVAFLVVIATAVFFIRKKRQIKKRDELRNAAAAAAAAAVEASGASQFKTTGTKDSSSDGSPTAVLNKAENGESPGPSTAHGSMESALMLGANGNHQLVLSTALSAVSTNGRMSTESEDPMTKIPPGWNVVDFDQLALGQLVGEGSFGKVYAGTYLQTRIAVKMLTKDPGALARQGSTNLSSLEGGSSGNGSSGMLLDEDGLGPGADISTGLLVALQKEAHMIASLRHPNIINFLGVCLKPPCLLMELCPKKSVDALLAAAATNNPAARLSWIRLLSMAYDAAKGLLYLHTRSPPIVHRDLKSPNLLVDGNWHVKVSDFNLSRAAQQDSRVSSLIITNPRWLAPEALRGELPGLPADVWSLGVVLWELATWKLPWKDYNPFGIITAVQADKKTLPIPDGDSLPPGKLNCWDEYIALMQDCWKYDPAERPSTEEVAIRLKNMLTNEVKKANNTNISIIL
jgi:hypothetical protein